eukprot:scaffold4427_cov417-Prasinococcus_capsulatus_cf.AAC.2
MVYDHRMMNTRRHVYLEQHGGCSCRTFECEALGCDSFRKFAYQIHIWPPRHWFAKRTAKEVDFDALRGILGR